MNIKIKKQDEANIVIIAQIEEINLQKSIDKEAKKLSKTIVIDGFRKGKVPISIIKQRFSKDLQKDAENEQIKEILNQGSLQAKIKPEEIYGEPIFIKYDRDNNKNLNIELIISLYPKVNLVDYNKIIPIFEKTKIDKKDIDKRLTDLIEAQSPFKMVTGRVLKDQDLSNIDFIGKIDGENFKGGEAKSFDLRIGSKTFIPTFEDKIIGMKIDETREITVKFPKEYKSELLRDKDVQFEVTLNSIQEKKIDILDDKLIEKLLGEKNSTKEQLLVKIEEALEKEENGKLYDKELKNKLLSNLEKEYNSFSIPISSLNQAVDNIINEKANDFTEEQIKDYKENSEKLEELRESFKEEASKRIRLYFVIEELAKKEKIVVEDKDAEEIIYKESVYLGKNPEKEIKTLKENNIFPSILMDLKTNRLFFKILGI